MKIFDQVDPWPSKVNFVDEVNNIVVGYDMFQDCCEQAGWAIADRILTDDECRGGFEGVGDDEVADYVFKTGEVEDHPHSGEFEGGGLVTFELVHKDHPNSEKPTLYLNLWNVHNGYYAHGFSVLKDNKEIASGSI